MTISTNYNKIIFYIIISSFLICVLYALHFYIQPVVDAGGYDQIAMNLLTGKGYREHPALPLLKDEVMARSGPAYEFFLAGIYFIFGHHYEAVWIIQAFLHSLTVLFLYLICKNIFERRREIVGLIAASLFAFNPDLIEISAMLMTETLYLFLTVLTILTFVHLYKNPNYFTALLLGLSFIFNYLTRQTIIFFLPIFLYFFYRKKLLKHFLFFIFICILIITPWIVRNYKLYREFIPGTVTGGFNLWIGNRPGSDGEQIMPKEVFEYMTEHGVVAAEKKGRSEFYNFIVHYPAEFTKLCFIRTMKYFSFIRPMGFWFYQKGIGQLIFVLSSAAYSVILFVLGLAGILISLKDKNKLLYYILFFTVVTPIPIILTVVETRYRFPIYPFLAIFAGFFIDKFLKKHPFRYKFLTISFVALVVNSLIDVALNFDRLKERLISFF